MKLNKLFLALALAASLFAGTASAAPEKPTKYVTDYAHVLSPQVVDSLNNELAQVERDTSNQVVVYIDNNNTSGGPIENAAIDDAKAWGIGQKNKDNGVLLLVYIKDRQMKLEVGNGLQGSLTDIESKQITGSLKPYFRSGDFNGGFTNAVNQIVAKVGKEGNKGSNRTVDEQQRDHAAAVAKQQQQNLSNKSFDHQNASGNSGLGGVLLIVLIIMGLIAATIAFAAKKLFGSNETVTSSSEDYTPSTYTPTSRSYDDYTPRPPQPNRTYSAPSPAPVPPAPSSHSRVGDFAAGAAAGVIGDEVVRSVSSRRRNDDDDSSSSASSSSYSSPSYSSSSSDDSSSSSSSSSSDSSSSSWSDSSSSSDFGGGGGDFSGGGSTDSW